MDLLKQAVRCNYADHRLAGFFKRVLVDGESTASVQKDVLAFREPLQTFYYNFDNGWPKYA